MLPLFPRNFLVGACHSQPKFRALSKHSDHLRPI
jgi:hypothetical protein